jgi:hypothetical protein
VLVALWAPTIPGLRPCVPHAISALARSVIGHPEAGQRTAILYSIIVSCLKHGHDPEAYIRDLLTRLPAMTNQTDLDALIPSRWHPPGVATPAAATADTEGALATPKAA